MKPKNVFSALAIYGSAEPENHLTESLAHVLRLLLARCSAQGLDLINRMCGLEEPGGFRVAEQVTVSTQVAISLPNKPGVGYIDLRIRSGDDTLVYVEIKLDSPLSRCQLESYHKHLEQTGVPSRRLVLLSRSFHTANGTCLEGALYQHICWYHVHDWLANLPDLDEVSRHFADDFMAFLEERRMSFHKVTWEYERGIPALLHLTQMLDTAIAEVIGHSPVKKTAGWSWRGFNVGGIYFLGVRYDTPLVVVFENNFGTGPTYKRDLRLDDCHFFALTAGEQMECLIEFLNGAIQDAPADESPTGEYMAEEEAD